MLLLLLRFPRNFSTGYMYVCIIRWDGEMDVLAQSVGFELLCGKLFI